MTDYLLVMAMMAIALVAVLIALVLDDHEQDEAADSDPELISDLQPDKGQPEELETKPDVLPKTPEPSASQGMST